MAQKRSKTSKIFAWVIVLILVLGLAGFGIQDVLRSSGRNEVASFGNQTISSDDYVRMIQQETRNLSQQIGTNLTFSQAQVLGVAQLALQKLISSAILDQTLEDLGISQSDALLKKSIKENPAFLDIAGRFSAEQYQDVLLNVNLQPHEYEAILRKELSRTLLAELMYTKLLDDKDTNNLIAGYFLEERVADVLVLRERSLDENVSVSDPEILSFYRESKDVFTQPKTTKISYVYLAPEDISQDQTVTEQEIRQAYDAQKEMFDIPEKRNIDQIFFDDKQTADTALESKATKTASFENILEQRGLKNDDVSIGDVTKSELPLEAQDELFSASVPSVIGPIKTSLGYALYRVNNSIPAIVKTYDSEYQSIKNDIALRKAQEELNEIMSFANDEIAGGLTLEDIASSTKMTFGKLDIFSGAILPEFAKSSTFQAMLTSGKKYASDVDLDASGAIFSIRIDNVVEPFVRDFESVKLLAKQKAFTKKLINKLEMKATLLIENIKMNDMSLSNVATNTKYELIQDQKLKRFDTVEKLPSEFSKALFSLKENDFKIISGENKIFIILLKTVIPGNIESEDGLLISEQLNKQFLTSREQDIFSAFVNGLKVEHSLSISQKTIDSTIARFN